MREQFETIAVIPFFAASSIGVSLPLIGCLELNSPSNIGL